MKYKEKILKAWREKLQITYKETPEGYQVIFFNTKSAGQKGVARYI